MNESGLWKNMIYVISKYQNFREVKGMYENEKKKMTKQIFTGWLKHVLCINKTI